MSNWDPNQYDSDDGVPIAQFLQIDQECNEVIQRTQALLEEITSNDCIGVEDIDRWNEDMFDNKSEYVLSSDGDSSDSSEDDVVEVSQVVSNTTVIESVNNLIKWCNKSELFSNSEKLGQ